MKKLFLITLILSFSQFLFADGLETFINFPETGSTYADGTFIGQDGSVWAYWQCRGDMLITDETPCLGKNRIPVSEVSSGVIADGIASFNFDYMQAFSTNVELDIYINDVWMATVTSNNEEGIVKNSGDIVVNIPGDFTIKFIQTNTSSGQVSVDNISWLSYGGSADPEPSNYPTNFSAATYGINIEINWTDATGTQLPLGYLIKASDQDNITLPVDGVPVADDTNLSDGEGIKNITYGIETYTFTNLNPTTTYYFKIFPYTNTGSLIDYKTDDTPPFDSASTFSIINTEDFEDGTFGSWASYNVASDKDWAVVDLGGALNTTYFAQMNGYNENELSNDWLISPSLDFSNYSMEMMVFYTTWKYGNTSDELMLKFSTDYISGDPTLATWTEITFSKPAVQDIWESSGYLDLSSISGSNVHLAFQYLSSGNPRRWSVDQVEITGDVSGFVPSDIVITEIMYNPPGDNADSLEFIEIYNNGASSVNLDGYYFSQGIEFTFPDVDLDPGNFIVISNDLMAFLGTFGYPSYEWASGNLNNDGELLELKDTLDVTVDMVLYDNEQPWDTLANGYGPSLTLCDPSSNNFLPQNWSASTEFAAVNGNGDSIWATPYAGCASALPKIVITEIMYNPPEEGTDSLEFIELFNNDLVPVELTGFYFSSGVTFTFPTITLAPEEYVVVSLKAEAMQQTFGLATLEWTEGGLSNSGELIELRNTEDMIIDFVEYADILPWDTLADGYGPSLTLCNPFVNNALPESWTASTEVAAINSAGDTIFATPGTGCGEIAPVANFVADHTTIEAGQGVNFTDISTGEPTTWLWSFPGGTPEISEDQHPADIIYEEQGVYDVILTVSNLYGEDTEFKSEYITVITSGLPPEADFSASATTLLSGTSVDFFDLSIGDPEPDSWQWSFPGGTPDTSNDQNPANIIYYTTGIYDVTLTVGNAVGETTLIREEFITVVDTTYYNLVITEIMYNSPETGDDSLEFIEIYNNDTQTINLNGYYFSEGIDYTFPDVDLMPGEYFVVSIDSMAMLNTFDVHAYQWPEGALSNSGEEIELKDAFGIIQDYVEYDDEEPWPIEPDGQGPSLTLCNPDDDNSLAENWSASTEFAAVNAAGDSIFATPFAGCFMMPEADFIASDTIILVGSSVDFNDISLGQPTSWFWAFEGGIPDISNERHPANIVYNEPGQFSVSLSAVNEFGSNTKIKENYIKVGYVPVADFTANETSISIGNTVLFTDLSSGDPDSWLWTFEGGTPETSTEQNPEIIYENAGDFDVNLTVTSLFGESTEVKTDYIHVSVGIEDIDLMNDISIYPNPSNGFITIRSNGLDVEYMIYSIVGELVYSGESDRIVDEIDLTSLTKGIYFINITEKQNHYQLTRKLIIK